MYNHTISEMAGDSVDGKISVDHVVVWSANLRKGPSVEYVGGGTFSNMGQRYSDKVRQGV